MRTQIEPGVQLSACLHALAEMGKGTTPNVWDYTLSADGTFSVYGNTQQDSMADADLVAYGIRHVDDAEFIATAKKAMPFLLYAARTLQAAVNSPTLVERNQVIRQAAMELSGWEVQS
jgi:hypothetical protein